MMTKESNHQSLQLEPTSDSANIVWSIRPLPSAQMLDAGFLKLATQQKLLKGIPGLKERGVAGEKPLMPEIRHGR